MTRRHDVIIVGGGMVGTALACALARARLTIALLEPRPPEPPGEDIDLRVSALSIASQQILDVLGAWDEIGSRCSPYREMRVWDSQGGAEIHFDSAEPGLPQLGWIIENRVVQSALWQRAGTQANITRYYPARLAGLQMETDEVRIELEDGQRLRGRLVVGADGAGSRVRQLAGIGITGRDYDQQALVTTVRTELPHAETAWQRFLPTGPLAFLPLADGQCSIVWSHRSAAANALAQLDEITLGRQLTDAFAGRLGEVAVTGPRATFPLRMQHAERYVQPNIALIGDAAHVVHPLAGQGVNLGLLDAAVLARVLQDAARRHRPLGALATLRRYERRRRGENQLMLYALDGIERLFGNRTPLLVWLRNTGLTLTDRIPPVKYLLARHAMGLSDRLPVPTHPPEPTTGDS